MIKQLVTTAAVLMFACSGSPPAGGGGGGGTSSGGGSAAGGGSGSVGGGSASNGGGAGSTGGGAAATGGGSASSGGGTASTGGGSGSTGGGSTSSGGGSATGGGTGASQPDASWSDAQLVSDAGNAGIPVAAVDGQGSLFIAWTTSAGETYAVRHNGGAWSNPVLVPFDGGVGLGQSSQLSIAANASGAAAVSDDDTTGHKLMVSRFSVAAGWSAVERVGANALPLDSSGLAIDDTGTLTAAWIQSVPGNLTNLFVARSDTPTTWALQAPTDAGAFTDLHVAGNGAGDQLLAFTSSIGGNHTWVATSLSDGGFATHPLAPGIYPQAGLGSAGNGAVCYAVLGSGVFVIHASTYDNGAWTQDSALFPDGGSSALNASRCGTAVDGSGNAYVAFAASDGNIYGSRHTSAGWTPTTNLTLSSGGGSADRPRVALASNGTGAVAWFSLGTPYGEAIATPFSLLGVRSAAGLQVSSPVTPVVDSTGTRWLVYSTGSSPEIFAVHNP